MRRLCWILSALFAIAQVNLIPAATKPARLAIIAGNETLEASDLLTTAFSVNDQITLLERTQIEKILREQNLSAKGLVATDALKVGQIIGADGLLTLDIAKEGTNTLLNARLIAVKQGVVMDLQQMAWPLKDLPGWSKITADHFKPLLPKLAVLQKDAIPISILNLRSAVSSSEGKDTERDLTLLLLNRLTHETNVFVLERRRLDQLAQEKSLNNLDDAPFWNGSYLLEGTIDKNGFIKDTITISARLRSRDGKSSDFEVSGSRKELATVINDLTVKVLSTLKQTNSNSWNPQDEATQYFAEASWALRWGLLTQAQTASESAWALGKRDLECASARINSYLPGVLANLGGYSTGAYYDGGLVDNMSRNAVLERIKSERGDRVAVRQMDETTIGYVTVPRAPAPEKVDEALHILDLYASFTRTLPDNEQTRGSPWHNLGLRVLDAASAVLQDFHFVKSSQLAVADKLAEVRRMSRLVAHKLSTPQSVRDSYWVGSRIATHDELGHTIGEGRNIFRIRMENGWLWQDHPEDGIANYRELLSSDVFIYIHESFWRRPLQSPWLATWNSTDEKRASTLWTNFESELEQSTNVLHQIESMCLKVRTVQDDIHLREAFTNLMSTVLTNRGRLVSNNVEVVYLNLGLSGLLDNPPWDTDGVREELKRLYSRQYWPLLNGMEGEYWAIASKRQAMEAKVRFLKTDAGTNSFEFFKAFAFGGYTKEDANELMPLLLSYKVRAEQYFERKDAREKEQMLSKIQGLQQQLQSALSPPTSVTNSTPPPKPSAGQYTFPAKPKTKSPFSSETNGLFVTRFFDVPKKELQAQIFGDLRIFAHRFHGEKLLLDLRWSDRATNGSYFEFRSAIAIFDPKDKSWDVIHYPARQAHEPAPFGFMGEVERGLFMELFENALYASVWDGLKKFDFKTRQWETLRIPDQKLSQLFVIHDHLYAANDEGIFEIFDSGKSMRFLASCRRRPAVSSLDSLNSLGSPVLFPGPGQSIRTTADGKIYSWDGKDWTAILSNPANQPPMTFDDTTTLRNIPFRRPGNLWLLQNNSTNAQLFLRPSVQSPLAEHDLSMGVLDRPGGNTGGSNQPKWKAPPELSLMDECARFGSNWLFLVESRERAAVTNPSQQQAPSRFHLACYNTESPQPLYIPIQFDSETAAAPVMSPNGVPGKSHIENAFRWMGVAGDYLLVGQAYLDGVWAIPLSELNSAISSRRGTADLSDKKSAGDKEQMRADLFKKYDLNKNGIFEANEISMMIDDPRWVELNWAQIDLNKNGFLDGEDNLLFFDADSDGVASPKELAAFKEIQARIAPGLIAQFDADGNNRLDSGEALAIITHEAKETVTQRFYFNSREHAKFDLNKDGQLDVVELTKMLEHLTRYSICKSPKLPINIRLKYPGIPQNEEALQMHFKNCLETIWKEQRSSAEKK